MPMASPTAPDPAYSRPTSGVASPRYDRSRTQSVSSDRPSTIGHGLGLTLPPVSVSPEPEFIAGSAAAQIVTNDHDSHAGTWYDQNGIEPPSDPAIVSPLALQLVNAFLDQLLFNFLQVARSANLSALRPAVSDVLKPNLARDAISSADEELREYLGSGDEDDFAALPSDAAASPRDWDVELVWKRTRLRCMVYSSLGDMEEEDEDLYMEQENLELGANEQASDTISPAAAIFLTSVLEYMGELTLTVAGQSAYNRVRAKIEKDLRDGTRNAIDSADRIVVAEMDMERVALDRTLGRLWRGWKKRMRYPAADLAVRPFSPAADLAARSFSPDSTGRSRHDAALAAGALSPRPASGDGAAAESRRLRAQHARRSRTGGGGDEPSCIPLPLGDNDVDEIEVPGLAHYSDEEPDDDDTRRRPAKVPPGRPKSLSIKLPVMANGLPTPTLSQPPTPAVATRKRSNSLPTPATSPFHASKQPIRAGQFAPAARDAAEPPCAAAAPSSTEAEPAVASRSEPSPRGPGEPALAKAAAPPTDDEPSSVPSSATLATAAAATAATAGAVAVARRRDSFSLHNDESDEDVVTYETAEIVTSSRVSIAGSSASASLASDGGKASTVKRSSSVHSARIVEVSGPRSPAHSRHTSVDTSERPRRISPSGLVSTPRSSIVEDEFKSRFIEHDVESPAYSPAPCPSLDRRRPPRPAAVPISETDEDRHRHRRDSPSPETGGASRAAHAPAADILGVRAKKEPAAMGAAGNRAPATNAMRREHTPSHIKVTTAAKGSSASAAGSFLDETIPEIPPKAPGHSGWQSPKADGRGTMPIERSKTRETDEDPALSSQNNATPRQIHTSGSSASSATSKLKPLRTSEENSSRAESVARNFEELIHSNQTITYTLTPENMRDIDSKRSLDSPVVTKFTRKSEETRGQNSPRSSPIAVEAPKSPLTHHHQPLTPTSPRAGDGKAAARSPGQVPVPRIPPGLGASSAGRAGGSQAREARNQGESTADFADFIKYSGPAAGERAAAPRLKIKTPTSPAPSSGGDPPSTTSSMNRGRYQPREAAVDTKVDSSDLIDFIRQGPPIAASNHRIPRHVAPFRSTMDSDQMSGAGGGMAVDATIPEIRYSQGSTNFTDNSMPSMQSSINSNSALLNNQGGPVASGAAPDQEGAMPKRKQRRVRDPYAIDLSDEDDEDDDLIATPRPPAKKEESLAEFLRNYEPPPEPPSEPPRLPRKKASAPSLIGRFTRGGSSRESKEFSGGSGGPPARAPAVAKQDSRSLSSRAGGKGGYIPIQVNMPPGYDKYGATEGAATSRPRMASTASSMGRVAMKKYEPREAVVSKSQTADLAAFLRDSVPPDGGGGGGGRAPVPRAAPGRNAARPDDGNGLSKMFGRKKKASAA